MPSLRAVLMMRQAISPRLAMRIRLNMPCQWAPDAGLLACVVIAKKSIAHIVWQEKERHPESNSGGCEAGQSHDTQVEGEAATSDGRADRQLGQHILCHRRQDSESRALVGQNPRAKAGD